MGCGPESGGWAGRRPGVARRAKPRLVVGALQPGVSGASTLGIAGLPADQGRDASKARDARDAPDTSTARDASTAKHASKARRASDPSTARDAHNSRSVKR